MALHVHNGCGWWLSHHFTPVKVTAMDIMLRIWFGRVQLWQYISDRGIFVYFAMCSFINSYKVHRDHPVGRALTSDWLSNGCLFSDALNTESWMNSQKIFLKTIIYPIFVHQSKVIALPAWWWCSNKLDLHGLETCVSKLPGFWFRTG